MLKIFKKDSSIGIKFRIHGETMENTIDTIVHFVVAQCIKPFPHGGLLVVFLQVQPAGTIEKTVLV